MAFESLQEKFSRIIKKLKGESTITESVLDNVLKEVKVALLEADVNYKVVKDFVNIVKEKAIGQEVMLKLNPSEMVIKIVKEELVDLLGGEKSELAISNNFNTYMLVGLQGSGKTTTCAKLAKLLKNKFNKKILLCACDIYRPAAIEQLIQLGSQINVEVFYDKDEKDVIKIAKRAREYAINNGFNVLIIDTAGRLQIDEVLMNEVQSLKEELKPNEVFLLTDAMAGQDSVNVAKAFNEKTKLTGVIMSKMDGDSRGGAALSICKVTNVPIKFIGIGEKINDLELFYPDRMAERILGMGDVLTLIDKVTDNFNEKDARKAAAKMTSGNFTLTDMLDQMKQVQKMGSLKGLLKLIPNAPKISDQQIDVAQKEMNNFEIIINSMTKEEKNNPDIIKNSRKIRIAKGCGKTAADINKVLKKYEQMKLMMKQMKNKKGGMFPPGFNGF